MLTGRTAVAKSASGRGSAAKCMLLVVVPNADSRRWAMSFSCDSNGHVPSVTRDARHGGEGLSIDGVDAVSLWRCSWTAVRTSPDRPR